MSDRYGSILTIDGTISQQSTTVDRGDYRDHAITFPMMGVVLAVYPSDSPDNRSAMQSEERRGYTHECDVLILADESSAYTLIRNVIVTSPHPIGVDDYAEKLPRPSSALVNGEEYNDLLQRIDPYELDGDWCVVGFIGGRIWNPFVVTWWPHARNVVDPATSGLGLEGRTLEQDRRYFRRVNGVESLITSNGDVVISTALAGGEVVLGGEVEAGRFKRDVDEDIGGAVRLEIKTSQALEITFDEPKEGVGVFSAPEPEMPQTNPKPSGTNTGGEKEFTFISFGSEDISFSNPGNFLISTDSELRATFEGNARLASGATLTLEGSTIKLGDDAASPEKVIKSDAFRQWLAGVTVDSPFGPLPLTSAYVQTLGLGAEVSNKVLVE